MSKHTQRQKKKQIHYFKNKEMGHFQLFSVSDITILVKYSFQLFHLELV